HVPLGTARVGHLRHRRPGPGLHDLPIWSPSFRSVAARAADGPSAHRILGRPRHRHRRHHRHSLRCRHLPGNGGGVLQIQAGLAHLGWIEPSNLFVIILVVGITAIGTLSVVSGVDKGIRWLSNTNMGMAGLLGLVVLIIGPTIFLLRSMVQNIGEYAQMIPQLAFVTGAGAEDGWTMAWTLFNQAWFLSWAPLVGMFIACISRGRTIREFILGVLLAPTAVSLVWLTIFGNSGLFYQLKNSNLVGDDGVVNT